MDAINLEIPIPLETALQLCADIRQEAEINWHTEAARWCWAARCSLCSSANGISVALRLAAADVTLSAGRAPRRQAGCSAGVEGHPSACTRSA